MFRNGGGILEVWKNTLDYINCEIRNRKIDFLNCPLGPQAKGYHQSVNSG